MISKVNLITITLLFLFLNGNAQTILDTLKTKAANNQKPGKWNNELFKNDKKWLRSAKNKPLKSLAFPVEKYDYYVFNTPFNFKINKETFSGVIFGENIGGKDNKFILKPELTLIFYTRDKEIQVNSDVSSRNYPYLTVQGQVEANNQFDFVGVKSPDNSGYLIVNMKTFDLRFGETVIIFPNKDNAFYYLQLQEKPGLNESAEKFVERIKTDSRITEMIKLSNEPEAVLP